MKKLLPALFVLICHASIGQNVALNFSGSTNYVETTCPAIPGGASRTISAWVNTTFNSDATTGGRQSVIADMGAMTPNGSRFTLNITFRNAIRIEIGGSGLSGNIAINDGNWHYVAAVYDSLAVLPYSLYVDGVLDTAGTLATAINTTTTGNLQIGRRMDGTNNFEGSIDEVRLYNTVLSQSQIQAGMNNLLCNIPAGLLAYYRFNEGIANGNNAANTTATDYSGNGYNGTLTGFTLSGTTSNWVTGPTLGGGYTNVTIYATACTSYTSPSGRYTWTLTGTYTDTVTSTTACDSALTIHLSLGSSNTNINVQACDTFIAHNGNPVTQSSTLVDTFTAGGGCDSVVTTDVTIYHSAHTTASLSTCDSVLINGLWYSSSQTVIVNGQTIHGCDSVASITLSVVPISDSVTQSGNVLSSHTYGVSYQWINCNTQSVMPGGTDSVYTATSNGTYALVVDNGTCRDTSACFTVSGLGIQERSGASARLVPNPNNGIFTVNFDPGTSVSSYRITDITGRAVIAGPADGGHTLFIREALEPGCYIVEVNSSEGMYVQRFVVQ